jgi:hypothetical protein
MPKSDDDPDSYIFVQKPLCRECQQPWPRPYKTIQQGDGTTLQYVECGQCGTKSKVVWTLFQ